MRKFSYTINSENGIHARPAGILVKKISGFKSDVKFFKGEKEANAKSLLSIMGLGIKDGEKLDVEICGVDEDILSEKLEEMLQNDFNANKVKETSGV
jgi:Phosphotransferase System HPr (HPr) Family